MNKVLIVEDSATVTKVLKHLLKQHPGIQPLFAASLAESQTLYEQHRDDLFAAIVDLNLPDAPDGETVDYFLERKLPVIVLTANYQQPIRDALMEKGVVDYIIKESRYAYGYALKLIDRLSKNRHIKVLVVEDSKPTRRFIRLLLQRHLYRVLEAGNGLEALDQLQQNPDIRLLITDYNMPEMDGFELVRTLRHNVDKSDLIIIGLSSEGEGSLSAKFIKNGANDFLQKPFYHEEFYCRITHNMEALELIEQIRDSASRDFLTNLHNRRYCFERGEALHRTAVENDNPLAVATLDIDHLKTVNDHYGHAGGDQVLCFVAEELGQAFSRFVTCRLGGEGFCILMPGLTNEQAYTLLDRFRSLVANMSIEIGDHSEPLLITLSAGVTNDKSGSLEDQIYRAGQLLQRAKQAGRNMVVRDDPD